MEGVYRAVLGGGEVGRLVFEPGRRWSNDLKAIPNTESCEAPHFQHHVSGKPAIQMDDGTELVAGPGDITSLPSAHDAWVVCSSPWRMGQSRICPSPTSPSIVL